MRLSGPTETVWGDPQAVRVIGRNASRSPTVVTPRVSVARPSTTTGGVLPHGSRRIRFVSSGWRRSPAPSTTSSDTPTGSGVTVPS